METMETIEKNGISYVSAAQIGRYYKLTRKRCWMELQKANLSYILLVQTRFYNATEAAKYFDNLGEYDMRKKTYKIKITTN